jgi:hypothetical protein
LETCDTADWQSALQFPNTLLADFEGKGEITLKFWKKREPGNPREPLKAGESLNKIAISSALGGSRKSRRKPMQT